MQSTIYSKNNELSNTLNRKNLWFTINNAHSSASFTSKVVPHCMADKQDKRWILCVDGNDSEVYSLAESVDKSKLLRVNGHQKKIPFDKIKNTLLKGNCATIVLCDPAFTAQEFRTLRLCAERGKTKVIVLNNSTPTIH